LRLESAFLAWLVGIHLVFLGSLLVLAIVDRPKAARADHDETKQP